MAGLRHHLSEQLSGAANKSRRRKGAQPRRFRSPIDRGQRDAGPRRSRHFLVRHAADGGRLSRGRKRFHRSENHAYS